MSALAHSTERIRRFNLTPGTWAVACYAGLILICSIWGLSLTAAGERLGLNAPPLFAKLEPRICIRIVPAIVLAGLATWYGHRIAQKVSWRSLLAISFAGAFAWAVALAAAGGWAALTAPVVNPLDAYSFVPQMGGAREFLRTFTQRIDSFPLHVQGHPPGLPLLLSLISAAGPAVVATIYIGAGASIVPAVLVAARSLSDEKTARSAAPWLVLAPYAIWIATSADAFYAGVCSWAIALMVSTRPVRALLGGMLFGGGLLLTYGAAPLAVVPLLVAFRRRDLRPLILAGAGAALVMATFLAFGFWWLDGLATTRVQYYAGIGGVRPYRYFLLANLAVLAIACGPAALRGVLSLKLNGAAWLTIGALIAVGAAHMSGLSKAEVERIWLIFFPWIVLGAGSIVTGRRWWLGAGAASAVLVQTLLVTPW